MILETDIDTIVANEHSFDIKCNCGMGYNWEEIQVKFKRISTNEIIKINSVPNEIKLNILTCYELICECCQNKNLVAEVYFDSEDTTNDVVDIAYLVVSFKNDREG